MWFRHLILICFGFLCVFVLFLSFLHHFLIIFCCILTFFAHLLPPPTLLPPHQKGFVQRHFKRRVAVWQQKGKKIKTVKTLTSVCVGLSVLTRFKVNIFPREQAPGQKYPPRILVSCRAVTYFVSKNTDCCHNLKNKKFNKIKFKIYQIKTHTIEFLMTSCF